MVDVDQGAKLEVGDSEVLLNWLYGLGTFFLWYCLGRQVENLLYGCLIGRVSQGWKCSFLWSGGCACEYILLLLDHGRAQSWYNMIPCVGELQAMWSPAFCIIGVRDYVCLWVKQQVYLASMSISTTMTWYYFLYI